MAQIRVDTLPKLEGHNYAAWRSEMLDLLALAGLEDTLEAENEATAANVRKALAAIRLAVSNAIKPQLQECETALAAWDALEERYKQQSQAAVLQLQQALLNVRMKSGESLSNYRSRVQELWAAATAGGAAVEEKHVVVCFLAGLSEAYEAVADGLAARGIKDLDEAELALLAVEQRIKSRDDGYDLPHNRAVIGIWGDCALHLLGSYRNRANGAQGCRDDSSRPSWRNRVCRSRWRFGGARNVRGDGRASRPRLILGPQTHFIGAAVDEALNLLPARVDKLHHFNGNLIELPRAEALPDRPARILSTKIVAKRNQGAVLVVGQILHDTTDAVMKIVGGFLHVTFQELARFRLGDRAPANVSSRHALDGSITNGRDAHHVEISGRLKAFPASNEIDGLFWDRAHLHSELLQDHRGQQAKQGSNYASATDRHPERPLQALNVLADRLSDFLNPGLYCAQSLPRRHPC